MKIFWAKRVVCPCPGAIYMCMTIIFKRLTISTLIIIYNVIDETHKPKCETKWEALNLSNGLCNFCKAETEDIWHLFNACPITNAVIKKR